MRVDLESLLEVNRKDCFDLVSTVEHEIACGLVPSASVWLHFVRRDAGGLVPVGKLVDTDFLRTCGAGVFSAPHIINYSHVRRKSSKTIYEALDEIWSSTSGKKLIVAGPRGGEDDVLNKIEFF